MTVPLCANFNNLMYITREQEHSKFPRRHDRVLAHKATSVPHAYSAVWYDDPRYNGSQRLPTPTAVMNRGIQYAPCVVKLGSICCTKKHAVTYISQYHIRKITLKKKLVRTKQFVQHFCALNKDTKCRPIRSAIILSRNMSHRNQTSL